MSFHKVLVANRGEIACRVLHTAHRLGYRTVAVFSDADAGAPHARQADEAVHIGPGPAAASYLDIAAVLEAARRTGADAVHPGYGFLSERADFADACAAAGLVFIGPPASAIRAMGDKAGAKRRMIEAGVPCAPGYLGQEQGDARFAAEAATLGLPLLVKAVAGGGGRGMRLVRTPRELPAALAGARREALAAFGDDRLMLERLIDGGRHIEIQVFADAHGQVVHLGERDCTAQRRRQKVVEEAPSPAVDEALRAAMGADAVAAARAVGYRGAGTVEFIVDPDRRYWFLEMNTRLQVEHAVTECVTGLDLVEWQLRVAAGEPLPALQPDIRLQGHAIEARLCVEDPYDGWMPHTGRVLAWAPTCKASSAEGGGVIAGGDPGSDPGTVRGGVRVDHGIEAGSEISAHYDPMVAKFVAHGVDRADATRRLVRALEDSPLIGLPSNARFLRDLLRHPDFVGATLTTTRLDEWAEAGAPILQRPEVPERAWALAATLRAPAATLRPTGLATCDITLSCEGERRTLRAPAVGLQVLGREGDSVRYLHDGVQRRAVCVDTGGTVHLALEGHVFRFTEPSSHGTHATPRTHAPTTDLLHARAPVTGTVGQVLVAVGDAVRTGQALVSVEAMKMEMWLQAGVVGTVRAVHAAPGATVAAGALLIELDAQETT